MEYRIADHISYLLFSHDCVIVPGFGGFILNREKAVCENDRVVAPKLSITFNQELRHNDGMLVTHLQHKENISYDSAYKRLKAAIAKINLDLKQGNRVLIGKIGVLYLNDNQAISFEPNKNYIHPDYIGLSDVHLSPLLLMEEGYPLPKKKSRFTYIAAAAVIALFFISPSINIGEQDIHRGQQADFTHIFMKTSIAETIKAVEEQSGADAIISKVDDAINNMPQAQKTSLRTYYIVVASETSKRRTDILLNRIQKDFPEVTLLKSSERYRLYTASFEDKDIAEDYLISFRKEYPKYKNAWLLSQRNK